MHCFSVVGFDRQCAGQVAIFSIMYYLTMKIVGTIEEIWYKRYSNLLIILLWYFVCIVFKLSFIDVLTGRFRLIVY